MIAPFIKPIRTSGGTFYTFSTAKNDLGFSFNNDDRKFRFSNYLLLNVPNIKTTTSRENFIQFDAIPGAFFIDGSKTLNAYLAESFQNYALNLETMINSSVSFDSDEKRSVAERVFFKWLKEIGAIRFREANNTELSDILYGQHFVEEDSSPTYSKVVQYIGEISIVNNIKNKDNAYSEVYIHIPTSHGAQPSVLFQTITDANYYPGAEFTNTPVSNLDAPYIHGRHYTDTHPAGLDFHAHFDSQFSSYSASGPLLQPAADFYVYDINDLLWYQYGINPEFYWWFPTPKTDTYFLESAFNDPSNDIFRLDNGTKNVEFVRSRLDGICVELNESAYKDISSNTNIQSFGELAESGLSSSFDFNTILVYYDMFDPNNEADSVKNLFGVLFLDNVESVSGGGGEIPRFSKIKPNSLLGSNGNAYSYKFNFKFDTSIEEVIVETTINDYNTFSLELYIDALNEMKETTRIFQEIASKFSSLENSISEIQGLVFSQSAITEIDQKITNLQSLIANSQSIFTNNDQLLALINRNYQEILNIYNNQTSLQIAYNLNVIKEGKGVTIDRNTQYVTISANNQDFTLTTKPRVSINTDFTINANTYTYEVELMNYSNFLKITDGSTGIPFNVDRNIVIYIRDIANSWSSGQKFRLSFTNGLDMQNTNGNFSLTIFTDAGDKLNTGLTYSAQVAFINFDEFENKNGKPVIEIICIDPKTFDFDVDIF